MTFHTDTKHKALKLPDSFSMVLCVRIVNGDGMAEEAHQIGNIKSELLKTPRRRVGAKEAQKGTEGKNQRLVYERK